MEEKPPMTAFVFFTLTRQFWQFWRDIRFLSLNVFFAPKNSKVALEYVYTGKKNFKIRFSTKF